MQWVEHIQCIWCVRLDTGMPGAFLSFNVLSYTCGFSSHNYVIKSKQASNG